MLKISQIVNEGEERERRLVDDHATATRELIDEQKGGAKSLLRLPQMKTRAIAQDLEDGKKRLETLSDFACMQLQQMDDSDDEEEDDAHEQQQNAVKHLLQPRPAPNHYYAQPYPVYPAPIQAYVGGQPAYHIPMPMPAPAPPAPCACDKCEEVRSSLEVMSACLQCLHRDLLGLQMMSLRLEEVMNFYKRATAGNISRARDTSNIREALSQLNSHLIMSLRSVINQVNSSVGEMPPALQQTLKRIMLSLPGKVKPPSAAGRVAEYGDQMRILIAGVSEMTRRMYEIITAYTRELSEAPRHKQNG